MPHYTNGALNSQIIAVLAILNFRKRPLLPLCKKEMTPKDIRETKNVRFITYIVCSAHF